jgi:hypothetical protein
MEATEAKTDSNLTRNLLLVASYLLLMTLIAVGWGS